MHRSNTAADLVAERGTQRHEELVSEAWRDEELVTLARKTLVMLCDARFRAGTLFNPTPDERAYFDACGTTAHLAGGLAYLNCANEVLSFWPLPDEGLGAEVEARLRFVHGALRATLAMERRGFLHLRNFPTERQARLRYTHEDAVEGVTTFSLCSSAHKLLEDALYAGRGLNWDVLRTMCDISPKEEKALRQLAERNRAKLRASDHNAAFIAEGLNRHWAADRQRAAEDVARHGLRTCALPECGATEPQPKTFKVCARCRAVCYCSAAHQQQDWRRHKREDGCAAAAAAAGK